MCSSIQQWQTRAVPSVNFLKKKNLLFYCSDLHDGTLPKDSKKGNGWKKDPCIYEKENQGIIIVSCPCSCIVQMFLYIHFHALLCFSADNECMSPDDIIFYINLYHQYFFISSHDHQSKHRQIISCVHFFPLFKLHVVLPVIFSLPLPLGLRDKCQMFLSAFCNMIQNDQKIKKHYSKKWIFFHI